MIFTHVHLLVQYIKYRILFCPFINTQEISKKCTFQILRIFVALSMRFFDALSLSNLFQGKQRFSLKRIKLTCTACVQSVTLMTAAWGGTYNACQKHESLSPLDLLSTGDLVLGIPFITNFKSNLCTALRAQNTKDQNCIVSHAHYTIAFQAHVFLTGIYCILLTNKGRSAYPQHKTQPRSTANSTVTICSALIFKRQMSYFLNV